MAAETRISNQERYFFHNNLAILLKAVEGRITTVDFRNEASITGLVEEVDGYMNIVMKNCTFIDPRGRSFSYDMFFVHSRNIRYVHIPAQTAARIDKQPTSDPTNFKSPETTQKLTQSVIQVLAASGNYFSIYKTFNEISKVRSDEFECPTVPDEQPTSHA